MDLLFEGKIWLWRGPSPFHFITVPQEQSEQLRAVSASITYGWGVLPVRVIIGATTWSTSLFPKNGGYIVPVKAAVRKAEGLEVDDCVAVRVVLDV